MDTIESYLLDKEVMIIQPKEGFHASMDTVFLSAACPPAEDMDILDIGCGVGSAGLCTLSRYSKSRLTAIDIQPELVELAQKNAKINGFEQRMITACVDIKDRKNIKDDLYDIVITNPPYLESGTNTPSPNKNKALSNGHHTDSANLKDWVYFAHRSLKPAGRLVLIHRADLVDKIVQEISSKFGNISIYPIWPKHDTPAKRVLIGACKNRHTPARILPGIILHEQDGRYTPEAEDILRGRSVINLWP